MVSTAELEILVQAEERRTPNDAIKEDLVILYSGGLDSTLLLRMATAIGHRPRALLIDYGQRHKHELKVAIRICIDWKIPYEMAQVNLPEVDSALTGRQIPNLYRGVSEWHVPGRNLIFLGLATSMAEARGINKIWFGPNYEDRIANFPDCTQEWVHSMNQVLAKTASFPIELEAPLLGMRKTTIQALAAHFGIDKEQVHSGYSVK